jgi:trans-aconitate methyltransferase
VGSSRKEHWEGVYASKLPHEVSWTQQVPQTSLDFIRGFRLPPTAAIIDVGGGDSRLVDHLLDEGYRNITVLDISAGAIDRAKMRLGERAASVKWVVCDITEFHPEQDYDCWHDRAAFHFLTASEEVDAYLATARRAVRGFLVVGTFSTDGPKRCSLLDVHQYSEQELQEQLSTGFQKIRCITEDHVTPFDTRQNFLFCSFRRSAN